MTRPCDPVGAVESQALAATVVAVRPQHKIRWFARFPGTEDDWTPRTAQMRGAWPWDVRCSCGWETRTGGATERSIRRDIQDHKWWMARRAHEEPA